MLQLIAAFLMLLSSPTWAAGIEPSVLMYALDSRVLKLTIHSPQVFTPDSSYRYFQDGVEYAHPAMLPDQGRGSRACFIHLRRPIVPAPTADETLAPGDCTVTLFEGGSMIFLVSADDSGCRKFSVSCYRRNGSTRSVSFGDFEQIMGSLMELSPTPATIQDDNLGVTDSVPSISGRAVRRNERRRRF